MPNLMLTNYCNYKCSYCFGKDIMYPKNPRLTMTRESFNGIVEWVKKGPSDRIFHLMGGEPTLNPDIDWMVARLLEENMLITIFSNLATRNAFELAKKIADLPVNWVVNVNDPKHWNKEQQQNITNSLSVLKSRASLTFNIMPDENDNLWALEYTQRFHLNNNIKVGFLLPTYNQTNVALEDDQYAVVADKVVRLAQEAAKVDVHLDYECGIPTCAFTDEQLGILWRCGSKLQSGCQSRLDITPDGNVIYCLPLATLGSKHFSQFDCYNDACIWFEQRFGPYRMLGRRIECATCNLHNSLSCNAGCLAKNLIDCKNIKL